jgi:hypothetical protein
VLCCCVLLGRCLCDVPIPRREESYRLWCVTVCDFETCRKRRLKPKEGFNTSKIIIIKIIIIIIIMFNTKSTSISGVTPCSLVDKYDSFRINHGRPNFLWQRATNVIVEWFAGRTCKIHSKWVPDGRFPWNLIFERFSKIHGIRLLVEFHREESFLRS